MASLDMLPDTAVKYIIENEPEIKTLPCGRWNMHPPHEWTSQYTKKMYRCKGDALLDEKED